MPEDADAPEPEEAVCLGAAFSALWSWLCAAAAGTSCRSFVCTTPSTVQAPFMSTVYPSGVSQSVRQYPLPSK